MARPLRLEYPGALWHVTSRGVEQRTIFLDDHDRRRFLTNIEVVVDQYRWRIYAYVLMSNHYHFLVQTPEPTLSRGMQKIGSVYAEKFNFRHNRVGHLFQGRFKSHPVDGETHLLEVARYIVLNPVRAGMVSTPEDWLWSSYAATAGLRPAPSWLDVETLLHEFHCYDRGVACSLYRTFVAEGIKRVTPSRSRGGQTPST
jgi:putative transposase